MANHYKARQRESDGKWHYTIYNNRFGVFPIGPCAENCKGHDTARDACEHYKEGMLKNIVYHDDKTDPESTCSKCDFKGCEEYTSGSAIVNAFDIFTLCKKHRNSFFISLMFTVGQSFES